VCVLEPNDYPKDLQEDWLRCSIVCVFQGFTGVTDMAGGYSAWVQSGMPIV
jgi:uncharacterized protein CbrC (UPF0167 family)